MFREDCEGPELTLPLLGRVCWGGFTLLRTVESLAAGVGFGSQGSSVTLSWESFFCHSCYVCQLENYSDFTCTMSDPPRWRTKPNRIGAGVGQGGWARQPFGYKRMTQSPRMPAQASLLKYSRHPRRSSRLCCAFRLNGPIDDELAVHHRIMSL